MEQLALFAEFPVQPGDRILEKMVRMSNLLQAYQRVKRNAGAPGVDGVTVQNFGVHLQSELTRAQTLVLNGEYRPQPVRTVEIPKPGGGTRRLGIPTVLDRVLQQALLQVLTSVFDPQFSKWSFGFRPGRGTHDAVKQARRHVQDGFRWVVDVDLAKFFDRVNHDVLMSLVARRIKDRGALLLIRRFLQSGIMMDGLTSPTMEGTPQGGPLSPLLSNIMLDVLDKELEKRNLRFCRYADDCNVYVGSRRSGERVMRSMTRFLDRRLRLQVNEQKTAVARPWHRQFLGYSVLPRKTAPLIVAPDRESRMRQKARPLLKAGRGRKLSQTLGLLAPKLRGWASYYVLCDVKAAFERFDGWLRRRLRAILWRQWKRPKTRRRELIRRGLDVQRAHRSAYNGRGPWWNAGASHMNCAVHTRELRKLGYVSLLEEYQRLKRSAG
jgi:RNA-directed DNA polymerase